METAEVPFHRSTGGLHRVSKLGFGYVFSLKTLGTLPDLELDQLSLVQRLIAIHLDRGEVNENIFSRLPLDETITLRCIEPLHHALFSSQRIRSSK